jgi:hypothetical protein
MTAPARVEGPVAGVPPTALGEFDLSRLGYVGEEWFVAGEATSYRAVGEISSDGQWVCEPGTTAPYTTRVVVRRPVDASRFNGTVVVEWFNVSGGTDVAPDWLYVHRELVRSGAAYVGVSAQRAGIEGGGLVPGPHLKQTDPARYEAMAHPGDAFSFDIFSQAAAATRSHPTLLGGLGVQRVLAAGDSQSAVFLVTYANAIDTHARVVDGVLLHGRGGSGAPLDGAILAAEDRQGFDLSRAVARMSAGHRVRDDVRVPVIIVQSETDQFLLGGLAARQPDTDRVRTWELAGAAHADAYAVIAGHFDDGTLPPAVLAKLMAPISAPFGLPVAKAINSGPQQHYCLQAAIAHLDRWVREGTPPPSAPPLATDTDGGLASDERGVAVGGLRTPWVDVPATVLSGLGQEGNVFGMLYGTTTALPLFDVLSLYPGGRGGYAAAFARATDEAVDAGHLLEADAAEIKAVGDASWPFWPLT